MSLFCQPVKSPLTFEEVRILFGSGLSSMEVLRDIQGRRLVEPLTPAQLLVLKQKGASDELLAYFNHQLLSTQESEAFKKKWALIEQRRKEEEAKKLEEANRLAAEQKERDRKQLAAEAQRKAMGLPSAEEFKEQQETVARLKEELEQEKIERLGTLRASLLAQRQGIKAEMLELRNRADYYPLYSADRNMLFDRIRACAKQIRDLDRQLQELGPES